MKEAKPKLPSNPSETLKRLNPHLFGMSISTPAPERISDGLRKPRDRKPMNKTETAFSHRLEAMKKRGEIVEWSREGITLRWPDGMTYSPDFAVIKYVYKPYLNSDASESAVSLRFIETKGAFIEADALVKFRAARAYWPLFHFEMWQLKRGEWNQIL